MANPQKSAIDAYLAELTALLGERMKMDRRIAKVEKVLRGMIDLLDTDEEQTEYIEKLDEIRPPAGLTEAIQQVLASEMGRDFFPTEIRDRVKSYLLNHSNQMASVHTTLKRLAKNNLFIEVVEKDGKTAYRMVSPGDRMVRDIQLRAIANKANDSHFGKTFGQRIADGDRVLREAAEVLEASRKTK